MKKDLATVWLGEELMEKIYVEHVVRKRVESSFSDHVVKKGGAEESFDDKVVKKKEMEFFSHVVRRRDYFWKLHSYFIHAIIFDRYGWSLSTIM
jgi:hypothetical protein